MFTISLGVYVYKMVDGLADVYEGRLQQVDKLYLAGVSQAFRSVVVLRGVLRCSCSSRATFAGACIAMAVAAAVTFLFLTFPLALFETPKSQRARTCAASAALFKQCFPLFVALFMYSLIDNMPKFVMEGVLSYDNQLYFNALYFPAQMILLDHRAWCTSRCSSAWPRRGPTPKSGERFDMSIVVIMLAIVAAHRSSWWCIMGWIGIPVMSFMYGLDFEPFRGLCFIMLAAGGVTAAIDFLYQVITVLRRQKAVTQAVRHHVRLLAVRAHPAGELHRAAGRGHRLPHRHVHPAGAAGFGVHRHPPGIRPGRQGHRGSARLRVRPSEARAERERREQVHAKWGSGAHARHETHDGEDGEDLARGR